MPLSDKDYALMQRIVRFTNISDQPFEHTFAWNEAPPMLHRFEPGETRVLQWPIANHLAKHLAMAILRGKLTTQELGRGKSFVSPENIAELKQKILSDESRFEPARPKTNNEIIADQISTLNPEDREIVSPKDSDDEENTVVMTKADVIGELERLGVKFNPRLSKAELEKQMNDELAKM